MPELPEVETTLRGIKPYLLGKTVTAVMVHEPRLRWPVEANLAQMVTGQTISGLNRRGKYLLLETSSGRLMIHLGMSGSLRVVRNGTARRKHDHLELLISTGKVLRFHDPRRFGSVFWLPNTEGHELIDNLGPEPLSKDFNADYLFEASRGRRITVKNFVMNSKIVVGIGNPEVTLPLNHHVVFVIRHLPRALAEIALHTRNASSQPHRNSDTRFWRLLLGPRYHFVSIKEVFKI